LLFFSFVIVISNNYPVAALFCILPLKRFGSSS